MDAVTYATAFPEVDHRKYRVIEKPSRIAIVDQNDVEICGARQPYGHNDWLIYPTMRLTQHLHQVVAGTRMSALYHLNMIAELWATRSG